ncbi:MAG TPA: hypothetical protein PKK74_06245 [Candidatus Methanoculleus thermohydrogenotrophicum]|jgi:hypothetical protein|nr:hypothetical protein [Candidatus Methanoculleus thermohydrogenotrophicum]HPZ38385.1 hypothetical protein [Candidatus Methanoculleus thermohydrogenotrophicum]HQC91520.1 hypothetical protein [Candidatus Methanoculleus thermohydrogenotrophicum]
MRPAMRAAAGGACILTGIVAALALSGLNLWIPILLIPFGILLVAGAVVERMKTDEGLPDDGRFRKILAFERSYAWQVSFGALMFLLLLDLTGAARLSGREVLVSLFFIMGISASAAEWHLLRKGDVG